MACSTASQQLRKELATSGADPFAIAAQALDRVAQLQEQVRILEALLPPKHKKGAPRPLFPLRLTPVTNRAH